MRLLNEMTPDERRAHEDDKRFCQACGRNERTRLNRRVFGDADPRVHEAARREPGRRPGVQITVEEIWSCDPYPTKAGRPDTGVVGLLIDFEHIGGPDEIVAVDPATQTDA